MIIQKKIEELKEYCVANNLDFDITINQIFDLGFNYIKYKDFIPKPKEKPTEKKEEIKVDPIIVEETPKSKPFKPLDIYGD